MATRFNGLHDCSTANPVVFRSRFEYSVLLYNEKTHGIVCELLDLLHPDATPDTVFLLDETPFEAMFNEGVTPEQQAYIQALPTREAAIAKWVYLLNKNLVDHFEVSLYDLNREKTTFCEYVWAVFQHQNGNTQILKYPTPLH